MRRIVFALPLLAVVPLALIAQPAAPREAPGKADPARVTAGTYAVESTHSQVGFEVMHFGFNPYLGLFGDVTGSMTLDPKNPNATKVDVMIPLTSVVTSSKGLNEHLLRAGKEGGKPDFFGPTPTAARFVSTGVVAKGMEAKITGNLTLNGVTKPVVLEAEFTGAGMNPFRKKETVGFEAETTIKRSDFGIMGALPLVGDDVELEITVAFERQ
jgi:polyisoprenoid-binding protein YceI